jgi:hypothetical protein
MGLAVLAIASSAIALRLQLDDRAVVPALIEAPVSVGVGNDGPSAPPDTRVQTLPPSPPAAPSRSIQGLRISIPRLGIDLPLDAGDIGRDVPRSGYTGGTPEAVALLYPGTNVPGEGSGNAYIYAHARTGMFLSLWDARVDDAVFVLKDDRSVVRAYRIALVLPRVDPSDTGWLDPSGPERLTLQTSTGPRPEDPRFIAVAYPIGPPTGTAARQPEGR